MSLVSHAASSQLVYRGRQVENELSEELSNDIRAAFNLFDTEQRGKIDASNLGAVGVSLCVIVDRTLQHDLCGAMVTCFFVSVLFAYLFVLVRFFLSLGSDCADSQVLWFAADGSATAAPSCQSWWRQSDSRSSDIGGGDVSRQTRPQGGNTEGL